MADGTLIFDTKIDSGNMKSELGNIDKQTSSLKDTFKNLGKTIVSAFAVDKVKDFGVEAVEAAAEAQAISAQFNQVFGDVGTQAQETIDNMADQFGMLPNRIKPSFTATTSMFMGLGLSTTDAMNEAEIAVTAASDAAAFYDKSYEDANAALNSFVKGNYEGGESIGLFANETQLAAWASENLGLKWADLSEADKQITRLNYATEMQKAAGATGQASRESNSYSNQLGNLKQAWEDFKAVIGEPILGVAVDGLKGLADGMQKVSEWGKENPGIIKAIVIAVGALAAIMLTYSVAQGIATFATAVFGVTLSAALWPIMLIIAGIAAVIAIVVILIKHWDAVKEAVGNVLDFIKELWGSIASWFDENVIQPIVSIFSSIVDFFRGIFETVTEAIHTVVDPWVEIFNRAWELIKLAFVPVKDFFIGIWNGIVSAFSFVVDFFGGIFSAAWNAIKTVLAPVFSFFYALWDGIKAPFVAVADWFKDIFSKAWEGVKNVFSAGGKIFDGIKDGIAGVFTTVVNGIIGGINKVIAIPFDAINGALGSLRKLSILGVKPFTWLPTIGVPQIPKLATGTVVPANYGEFQAILGDNTREPEIVSPLSTMKQALKEALAESGGTNRPIQLVVQLGSKILLQELIELNENNTIKTGRNALA